MTAKGKGKGYQGYCYDCGNQGHKRGEPACWMASAPIPMDISAVSQAAAKDVAAVDVGGGAIWELDCCQVEVYRGGDADGEQASRADGWKVAASRKTKRWERKKDKDRPQPPRAHERDVMSQIEQRSTHIEN